MDAVELFINQAIEHKKNNRFHEAISSYSEAFDYLIMEARNFAQKTVGYIDKGKTRTIFPEYFDAVRSYFRRDKNASHISNNMGVLYARLNDLKSARKLFKQAIEFYPKNEVYKEAIKNLEEIKCE